MNTNDDQRLRDWYEYQATREAYDKHPYEYWQRSMWAWRIGMVVAIAVLLWAATTDKKNTVRRVDNPTTSIVSGR